MFELLIEKMKQHGKFQYEVSNFAEPGHESKHNLTYWDNNYYYGFGAGASGYLPGKRHINLRPFPAYVKEANASGQPILHIDEVGKKEQIEEEMFLGLRKRTGVNKNVFKQKYNVTIDQIYQEQIQDLIARSWLEETSDYVRMTEKGQLFGNEVFQRFLLDDQEFNKLFK